MGGVDVDGSQSIRLKGLPVCRNGGFPEPGVAIGRVRGAVAVGRSEGGHQTSLQQQIKKDRDGSPVF